MPKSRLRVVSFFFVTVCVYIHEIVVTEELSNEKRLMRDPELTEVLVFVT